MKKGPKQLIRFFSNLSLRWKIYLSLTAIVLPVFILTYVIEIRMTRPLLEEEIRQIGISVCKSLATDLTAYRLLDKPDEVEAKLVEMAWLQPSIARIDVVKKSGSELKVIASNLVEDPSLDLSDIITGTKSDERPRATYVKENDRKFWEIIYPIKENKKIVAYIRAEASVSLASQVENAFSKVIILGALLAIALLVLILSYYLRRMIENERMLRKAEFENVELSTQLHEVQRQLFINEKLAVMGQLTASFAHEIGTPLNSLSGHLQLLREDLESESQKNRVEIINSQVSRIEGIVKDFLASTHKPAQQKKLVQVSDVIERIVKLVTPRAKAIGTDVQIKISPKVEPLRVVPTDLEQVLLNLTNNALDALEQSNKRHRTLEFKASDPKENTKSILIEVSDSGDGIDADSLKKVLKPFFTTKPPGKGTGLGLTISQQLVKKYGGKLEVDSKPGVGTTVKVKIPYELPV
ncbi:MAG: sensor histidine kinase [Bacteriovoracia bacterium]